MREITREPREIARLHNEEYQAEECEDKRDAKQRFRASRLLFLGGHAGEDGDDRRWDRADPAAEEAHQMQRPRVLLGKNKWPFRFE